MKILDAFLMLAVVVICGGGLLYGKYYNDKHKRDSVMSQIESAYRQGQIDAINGKVMYELQPLPTGETVWVKKKASE